METVLSSFSRQITVHVKESSAVSAARRTASEIARTIGFDETAKGEVALAVTEAATNIVKHAGEGEILIRPLQCGTAFGIEVLAVDTGPGMSNIARSMQDGTSTAGSYGIGLGAMRRIADEFDIYTAPGKGTVIGMTMWAKTGERSSLPVQMGVVCLPLPSETVCGDAWGIAVAPTLATIVVADGLGHGADAAVASEAATASITQFPDAPPATALHDIHLALRATRGAAVAVARLDMMSEQIQFAGIGNIAASVFTDGTRYQMVSHNGIAGSNMRKVQEFPGTWNADSTLIMCSDGLGTRWDLNKYPGLILCHPRIIAAMLYRDFARRRDDVTVLVVRENRGT